jgi:hypothetical protein
MQYDDLDKTKVLKTQRDFMSDVRKPNSKSVLKSVIPVRPVLNISQTDWTYPRASRVHRTCPVPLPASRAEGPETATRGGWMGANQNSSRNLAYVPKSTRDLSFSAQSRPSSYRWAIGLRNWARNCNKYTTLKQFISSRAFHRTLGEHIREAAVGE